MKPLALVIAVITAGCAATPPVTRSERIEMPMIPDKIVPIDGNVVEYWPNGKTRSERVYRSGRVQEAAYYASDGSVIYEMSEDTPDAASDGE
jgi:hypothetical protein